GARGPGGAGGHAGTGNVTGGVGVPGGPGDSDAGGLYVDGGSISIDNSTVALNTQDGGGSADGVVQAAGKVTAASSLFPGNAKTDYPRDITPTQSLFPRAPAPAAATWGARTRSPPPARPKDTGGPPQTTALQAQTPAIGTGATPETPLTAQRGSPRPGPASTDIGAYQSGAPSDTQAPT